MTQNQIKRAFNLATYNNRKIKQKSKYVPYEIYVKATKKLSELDKYILEIYRLTAIRLSSIEQYIELIIEAPINAKYVDFTPRKKNNKRLLPIIEPYDWDLIKGVSFTEKAIAQRIQRLKLPFTAHDLRATFITNALERDLPPVKIQHLVGHKRLSTTLGYARLQTENSLWMYDYINNPLEAWETSDDINELKTANKTLARQNAKLKNRLKKLNKKRGK